MTIEECYEIMGGNYAEVSKRLPGLKTIEKFIGIFLDDESFETLRMQIECKNREKAFSASHTLKGICANLSFTRLFDSAARLTEELRTGTSSVSDTAIELFKEVERDYQVTVDSIHGYLDQSE